MGEVVAPGVSGLVAHFERFLGPGTSGWMKSNSGELLPFQVVRWTRGPDVGSVAYSTLGLSRNVLAAGPSGDPTPVRQELVVMVTKSLPVEYVLGVFVDAAHVALSTGRALRRGSVLGPVQPVLPLTPSPAAPAAPTAPVRPRSGIWGSEVSALYVADPVYLPDEFARFAGEGGPDVQVLWLVPITSAEARFVREQGWEAFEDLLVDQDPDLVDVFRAPVKLPAAELSFDPA
ncbi:suppressor of fused domain protein [Nocardioides yefusunii]|uniref:Suppressor of fused domain protein n=1 Tax=Nocardioides yefusunii TaxID=2500546 RepID=A0ABW1QUB5_9ACTN|nr:suppressor of fused domain protein [Nocardioides yefusunii]